MNYSFLLICILVLLVGVFAGIFMKKGVIMVPCAILIAVLAGVFAYQTSGSILKVVLAFGGITLIEIIILLIGKFILERKQ